MTGGAGFVGSHLVDALVMAGHEVQYTPPPSPLLISLYQTAVTLTVQVLLRATVQ